MGTYLLTAPDGKKYRVTGETPEGALEALKSTMGAPQPQGQGFGNNVAQAAGDGLFMGFGDEISARLNAMTGYDANTGSYGNWGTTYDDQLSAVRGQEKQFRQDHPVISTGAEIAGGVAAAALPIGHVARGTSLANQSVRAAATGGAMGAAYGFAEGEGGFANRAGQMPLNAVFGATIGGAIPAVGNLVGRGVRGAQDFAKNRSIGRSVGNALGIDRRAGNILSDLAGMGNPQAMQQSLAKGGKGAMLADANPAMVDALDTIMRLPGDGARIASQRIDDRAGGAYDGIMDALVPQQGPQMSVAGQMRQIQQSTAGQRGAAYDRAYSQEIDWRSPAGERLRQLIDTMPDSVLQRAKGELDMRPPVGPAVPDSAYADEFADTVTRGTGPKSWIAREQEDVDRFFTEYNSQRGLGFEKRPLTNSIKQLGGIDPNSPAGKELKAIGLTSRNSPGLFRVGGLKDVDNLFPDLFPDTVRQMGDGTGHYMDRNTILQSIRDEMNGAAVRSNDEIMSGRYADELERLVPEYEARAAELDRLAGMPDPPPVVGDAVPVRTVEDIDRIKRVLDDVRRSETDSFTKIPSSMAVQAGDRANAVRDALIEVAPGYDDALALGKDTIRRREAVEFGAGLVSPRTTTDAALEQIAKATDAEKKAMRQGMTSHIREVLGNIKAVPSDQNIDARQARRAWTDLSSPNARIKMEALFGDEWPGIQRSLDEAGSALGLRASTAANSRTAGREAFREMLGDATAPGALAQGKPLALGRSFWQRLTGGSPENMQRVQVGIRDQLADVMTRPGADATLAAIEAARRGAKVNPALAALMNRRAMAGMMGAVPQVSSGLAGLLRQ